MILVIGNLFAGRVKQQVGLLIRVQAPSFAAHHSVSHAVQLGSADSAVDRAGVAGSREQRFSGPTIRHRDFRVVPEAFRI